ncbi:MULTISPECIES: helix-turn-helix domain-containing protein [unclassified Nonomuraea]|uniref:helix-turn-helix domain-containing protein n=1 Tax=unclassified Nonomuraea TaxID=2593643 RepID=UPI001377EC84|nr:MULTISPECIES: helix-turn-helix transcriptional regulator [unclassified Nonomuraea]NBE94313.1 helix-turn-helix domain-containing protein [Nonomuraea sp. K271]
MDAVRGGSKHGADVRVQPPSLETPVYGVVLKNARTAAGLSQVALGNVLSCSESLIGLVERGQRKPTKSFTIAAEAALGLNGELFRLLPNTRVMSVPNWFSEWPTVEENAHTIRTWQPLVIPGLLRTPRYARAILAAEPGATERWVEEAVETRLRRQSVFERDDPPMYWALVDECVLLRPFGGKEVMREQLVHLLEMAERPNISVQLVPLEVGATAGLLGGFALAQSDGMPDRVYLDSAAHGTVSAREETVRQVSVRYDAIHKWAHPAHVSRRQVCEVAAGYGLQ